MRYIAVVRKREQLALDVAALDDDGAGVGAAGGVEVHVAGALPGERVAAIVEHVSPHAPRVWARLLAVERAAAERVAPACAAFGACGGCPLEHLAYEAQLAYKTRRVRDALAAAASAASSASGASSGTPAAVDACVPSPRPLGYRNKSKLVYAEADGQPLLGAYAPRTHRVVDLAGCRVAEPPLDDVAGALRDVLEATRVEPYDERTHGGTLRYAVLRANFRGEVLAVLVTAGRAGPAGADAAWHDGVAVARALRAARPEVVGVVQHVNPTRGNALFGGDDVVLDGAGRLDERIGDAQLTLSPTAFVQVNRDVAARIYADVREAARLTGRERVVDVYAGVGGLAYTLAPAAREVLGIESHAGAVDDANRAPESAGHARFVCADAADGLAAIDAADVVVLNPPRRGCEPRVLDEVVRLGPRTVVYVSCAPDTLARDLARLGGYALVRATPYDMIPQTPHVETVVVLERR
jgi:23S rRNA (uracil1939-C5)-methyltransferase